MCPGYEHKTGFDLSGNTGNYDGKIITQGSYDVPRNGGQEGTASL
jgi:hypothetical protein